MMKLKQQIETIKLKLHLAFLDLFPAIMLFLPSGSFFFYFKPTRPNNLLMTRFADTAVLKHNVQPLHPILTTRHTSMCSLTFRVRVTTPRSMDEMERRTQQARRFYRRRGESSPSCVVRGTACGGWAWRITAGLCRAFP